MTDQSVISEITTTLPTQESAELLARSLVESSLAACIQINGPVTSIYRWDGVVQKEQEFAVKIKTSTNKTESVVAFLMANHPYKVPEILVHRVCSSADYSTWINEIES